MVKFDSSVNVVSLSNLIVLTGIFVTAIGAWFTLQSTVDNLKVKMDQFEGRLVHANRARDEAVSALRSRNEALIELFQSAQQRTVERMAIIETKVDNLSSNQKRTQENLDTILRRLPMQDSN